MIDSNKLKGRIIECGFNQKDIANLFGVSTVTVNQKINNKRAMTVQEAIKISNYLNIKPYDYELYFFK